MNKQLLERLLNLAGINENLSIEERKEYLEDVIRYIDIARSKIENEDELWIIKDSLHTAMNYLDSAMEKEKGKQEIGSFSLEFK